MFFFNLIPSRPPDPPMHRKSNMEYSMIPVQGVVIVNVNELTLVTRLINALSITFVFLQIFGKEVRLKSRMESKHSIFIIVKSGYLTHVRSGKRCHLRPAPAKCPALISKLVCHVTLFKNNSQM